MSFTQLWIIWGVMFAVIEGAAIIKKSPGTQTLTEHVTKWASLKDKSKGWLARRLGLGGFAVWIIYHFVSRIEW